MWPSERFAGHGSMGTEIYLILTFWLLRVKTSLTIRLGLETRRSCEQQLHSRITCDCSCYLPVIDASPLILCRPCSSVVWNEGVVYWNHVDM